MTATPKAYRPRFYSEVIREAGSPDDCVVCASLELFDAATLGEGVTRNDGRLMDTIFLRELRDNAGLTPDGPLRLNDAAKYLEYVSTRAGMDPPFRLDYYPGHPGGKLRVTWDEFKAKVRDGHIAVLLGNPIGVKDANSPLRSVQNSDDYAHAIGVMDGSTNGALVFDALNRKGERFAGVRVGWDDLRQFTSAKDWAFGSPTAIACAVVKVGDQTQAKRTQAEADKVIARRTAMLEGQRAQTKLATEERDTARAEAALAQTAVSELRQATTILAARITELENATSPDCAAAVEAEKDRLLKRFESVHEGFLTVIEQERAA